MSVFLDHNYCSMVPPEDVKNDNILVETGEKSIKIDAFREEERLSVKDDICVDFTNSDAILSSLSPTHSTDSGVEPGMEDFWTKFSRSNPWSDDLDFGLCDDDLTDLEALLSENFATNKLSVGEESHPKRSSTVPSTQTSISMRKGKPILGQGEDDPAMIDRNRKNAIAARENRQKKKKYVEGLENEVGKLKEENKTLKTRNESMSNMILKLSDEVKYLRSVLANESTISLLLKSVAATPGISLTSSLAQSSAGNKKETAMEKKKSQYITRSRKRQSVEEQSSDVVEPSPSKKACRSNPGGVCLHVNSGKVSLELCARCEKKALQS